MPYVPGSTEVVRSSPGRAIALDGLRGLAVAATVAFHLPVSPAAGGMAGVDMFFVLSGFLIGGILLGQATQGRVRLAEFWAARARRLFPALVVMLVVTGCVAWWQASAGQWTLWKQEAAWAAWYSQNFFLITIADNYFAEGQDTPFGHLWSLAVEEQFYLFFPLLVVVTLAVSRRWWQGRVRLAVCILSLGLAGGGLLFFQGAFNPADSSLSYYDPRGHSFGILAGVALAGGAPPLLAAISRSRTATRALQVAAAGALGVIGALALSPTTSHSYVRLVAPTVVLATLVAILACMTPGIVTRALQFKPLVWLGVVSYGVYLWSVPVSTLLGKPVLESGLLPGWAVSVATAAVTLAVAWASFTFVEWPVRASAWLKSRTGVTLVGSIAALALLGVAFLLVPARAGVQYAGQGAATSGMPTCSEFEAFGSDGILPHAGCVLYDPGDKTELTVVLAGNSIIQSMETGFYEMARKRNWRLWSASVSTCPLVPEAFIQGVQGDFCYEVTRSLNTLLATGEVDLVVAADMTGLGASPNPSAVTEGYRDALTRWSSQTGVLLIKDYPTLDPPGTTRFTLSPQGEYVARIWTDRARYLEQSNTILEDAARGLAGVHVVDLAPLLCPDGWPCPMVTTQSSQPIRWDQVHMSPPGSVEVVKWLARDITEAVEMGKLSRP